MRSVLTCAAHSGLALAPLTSSTVTCASRAVGAVTFGVVLFEPPQAAPASTAMSATARVSERWTGRCLRVIGFPLHRGCGGSGGSQRGSAAGEPGSELALGDQEDHERRQADD